MDEVRRIRQERGMKQTELAAASGVDRATLNQLEGGRRSPTIATLERLADALACEVGDFFPKAQPPLTPERVPDGSPDPQFWGPDSERPDPTVEGMPGPGGHHISVRIEDGAGPTQVKITREAFLELFRKVRRGEISPEAAVSEVERTSAA